MDDKQVYSAHIYDSTRVDLARNLVEKELRKLLLSLPDDVWKNIDQSIHGWLKEPVRYHLEDGGPRDFWDAFAAIIESIKLKPNFTAWITAENVTWSKKTIAVKDIQMTSPLGQLKKVSGLNLRNDLPFAEIIDVLSDNREVLEEQKVLIDEHSTDPAQDKYPIIIQKTDNGPLKVMDGNRRTLKAVIYGQEKLDAWVGEKTVNELKNFWIPINDMFQLVKIFKEAQEYNNQEVQKAVATVLKSRFEASSVARQAYKQRIGNQNKVAEDLYKATQVLK